MNVQNIGFVVLSKNVRKASEFYARHLGFTPLVVLDWFASHEHPDHPGVYLDIIQEGHVAGGPGMQGRATDGTMLALIVSNAHTEYDRLKGDDVDIIMPLADEPWGQRRFQLKGPDNVVVEIIEKIAPDMEWLKANS